MLTAILKNPACEQFQISIAAIQACSENIVLQISGKAY